MMCEMIRNYKTIALYFVLICLMSVTGSYTYGASQLSPGSPANLGVTPGAAILPDTKIPPEVLILRGIEKELKEKFKKDVFRASSISSLIYTTEQYASLSEARIGFNARIPLLKDASGKDLPDPNDPNYRPPPSVRKLELGGIVFNNPDEWTIYLNGKRVTPDLLPPEALDLRVYKDFIELRWFDVQTNKIFPVRLRPNQTFNIDARIFLPG